jgi:hypothetical protein
MVMEYHNFVMYQSHTSPPDTVDLSRNSIIFFFLHFEVETK